RHPGTAPGSSLIGGPSPAAGRSTLSAGRREGRPQLGKAEAMTVRGRLTRLEATLRAGGPCPSCPGHVLLAYRQGEGPPPLPPPCSRCGREQPVTLVEEVIVSTREEADFWQAATRAQPAGP